MEAHTEDLEDDVNNKTKQASGWVRLLSFVRALNPNIYDTNND